MAEITERPPDEIIADMAGLRASLDSSSIPPKQLDRNILIATWNIQVFGNVTKKWVSAQSDSPKRDLRSILAIAEIVSRFDVIAIQEAKANLRALRYLLKVLGPHWGLLLTDANRGTKGNDERLAFVFDTRRVKPSGLACELVIPEDDPNAIPANEFQRQFVRTPYAVSFISSHETFILVTLHINYGQTSADRKGELTAIAKWLKEWAEYEHKWGHNFIALGDFNIDRKGDSLYKAFTKTGLTIPQHLENLPRTIFDDPDEPDKYKFYDQIAWFTQPGTDLPALNLEYSQGGNFNFVGKVMNDLTPAKLQWRLSNHCPLWVEFLTRRDYELAF